jgi:hypothetical protein
VTDDCVVCLVFCEHCNEPLGSVSFGKLLYRLIEYQLLSVEEFLLIHNSLLIAVFCEHGNEPLGSVSVGKIIYRSVECQLVNKDSAPLGLCNIIHVIQLCTQLQYPAKEFWQVKIGNG